MSISAPFHSFRFLLAGASLILAVAAQAKYTVVWTDNSWDETCFSIERADGPGAFREIATVPANQISFVDNGADATTKYLYRVRAMNDAGYSEYSNAISTAA